MSVPRTIPSIAKVTLRGFGPLTAACQLTTPEIVWPAIGEIVAIASLFEDAEREAVALRRKRRFLTDGLRLPWRCLPLCLPDFFTWVAPVAATAPLVGATIAAVATVRAIAR